MIYRRGGAGHIVGEDYDTMSSKNFDSTLPTKFYIHGWLAAGSNWYVSDMRQELIIYVSVQTFVNRSSTILALF